MTAIVVVILFFVVQLIAGLSALLFSNLDMIGSGVDVDTLSPSPVTTGVCLLVAELILSFGLWMWFYHFEKPIRQRSEERPELLKIFKFKPLSRELLPKPTPWINVIFAVLATLMLSLGISSLIELLGLPAGHTVIEQEMIQNPWCVLLLCVVGPVCEELTFREGVVRSLYRHRLPSWAAIGISAAAFAVIHGNLAQGIPAFLIGIVFGLYYIRTGNLRMCVASHIANNTVSVLLMRTPQFSPQSSVLFTLVAVLAGLAFLAVAMKTKKQPQTTN